MMLPASLESFHGEWAASAYGCRDTGAELPGPLATAVTADNGCATVNLALKA